MSHRDRIPLSPRGLTGVCAGLVLAMAAHWPRLPLWATAVFLLCVAWRLTVAWRGLRPVPSALRLALTVVAVMGTWASYGTLFGREAGVTLLALMLSLKLLEVTRLRDAFLVGSLSYFLIVTAFLFHQGPFLAAFQVVAVIGVTTGLMLVQDPRGQVSIGHTARRAGALLAQSVPLMAVMFLVFPRLASPLWGVPDTESAKTGLSEEMSPGSISQLFIDDSPAFRVTFDGDIPETAGLYWRGPVMWRYDGETWTRGRVPWGQAPSLERASDVVSYSLALEPHNRHWLFALSMPLEVPKGAVMTGDFELIRRRPVSELYSYDMRSARDYVDSPGLSEPVRRAALQLPPEYNPRTVAMGQRLARESAAPADVVQRLMRHFRQEPFVYTLNPAPLGRHAMDEFLFETRQGYCEHYASAFVVLARAAGIPARVVTGYLGGDVNPIGDYLVVRQSDAHAWAEVWFENRGWVSVDATGAVAPERIEIAGGGPIAASGDWGWLGRFGMAWDALQNVWNRWVLGYDQEIQKRLMRGLGGDDRWQTAAAWIAVAGVAGLGLGVLWALLGARPARKDPVQSEWTKLRRKLVRGGLHDHPALGPRTLTQKAQTRWPKQSERLGEIGSRYIQLRYQPHAPADAFERLKQEIRHLDLSEQDAVSAVKIH